jgi:hypothetical protein
MRTVHWLTLISLFCTASEAVRADESSPSASGAKASPGAKESVTPPTGGDYLDILGKKPMSFAVGPFGLSPMLEVSESYNDNMFFNNQNRKGSMLTQVQLGLQLEFNRGFDHYDLQYGFRSWSWHSSPTDDYLDQFVGIKTHTEFTSRNKLDIKANYIDSHNLRGTYFTAPGLPFSQLPQPDTYHEYNAEAKYRYGVGTAQGNLELITGVNDLTYDTRPEVTHTYDKTRIYLIPGFYYRIRPQTQLLAQIEATWYRYKYQTTPTNYDFNLQRYLLGAKWQATQKTTGSFRIGYMAQQYASGSGGLNTATGDIGVTWAPLSYSRFNLNFSRNVMPTIGYGTLALFNQVSIGWTHNWTSRIRTQLELGYIDVVNQNVSTPGVNSNQVTNNYYTASVGADYAIQDWLSVGLDYKFNNLSSSYSVQNYDQNRIMLYVTLNPLAASHTSAPWGFNFGPVNFYDF